VTQPPVTAAAALSDATISRLLDAIERQTGMSRDAGLPARLQRALRTQETSALHALVPRLEATHWRDPDWQALLTRLLVHETYFFRDWPQLEHLALNGLPERISRASDCGHHSLCVWSAGCASGEEAYSLAAITMHAMLRAGVAHEHGDTMQPRAGWRLDVVGSDLSGEMVARAGRGVYETAGLSSFRAMRDGYGRLFPADGTGTRVVRQDLRARVRFAQDNLLDGAPPVSSADVVVCRNVLVYFADAARQMALAKLTDALAEGGYLLLGPTDPRPPADRFDAIWSEGPVIYRRRPVTPPP
jgi:chemotaxis protein methyltransferase CheR